MWSLNGNSVSDLYWIWPLAHFTTHQWSTNVLLHSLYMYIAVCGAGRQRCTVSPLSHLLSPPFIDPNHTTDIYLSYVCVLVCMLLCAGMILCLYACLYFVCESMGVYLCQPECLWVCVCQRHATAALSPPSIALLIVPLMTECIILPPPHPQKNWWRCHPEIPFVALPSGITINNHDIIPFLSMGRPELIDSMAPTV